MPDNKFWRDSSDRLAFEMFRLPANKYRAICRAVAAKFRLVADNALVTNGFDIAFRDYRRHEQVVELAWDNWTGFTVVAKSPVSEPLVREIAAWLLESDWATASSIQESGAAERENE